MMKIDSPVHPPKVKYFFKYFLLLSLLGVQYFLKYFFKSVIPTCSLLVPPSTLTRVPTLDRGCMSLNEGTTAIHEIHMKTGMVFGP